METQETKTEAGRRPGKAVATRSAVRPNKYRLRSRKQKEGQGVGEL